MAKPEQTAKEGQVLGDLETNEAGVQTQLSLEDIAYLEKNSCDVRIVHNTFLTQDFLQSDDSKAAAAIKFILAFLHIPASWLCLALYQLI